MSISIYDLNDCNNNNNTNQSFNCSLFYTKTQICANHGKILRKLTKEWVKTEMFNLHSSFDS